jgi:hypothetical protein
MPLATTILAIVAGGTALALALARAASRTYPERRTPAPEHHRPSTT